MFLRSIAVAAFSATLLTYPCLAQQSPVRQPYTLRSQVREVLTDVTVTDAQGNPVTGLPESAFHISDNGNPQTIDSFVAHSGKDRTTLSSDLAPDVYSNRYLTHPPAVYNIALIDVTTMGLVDQMVLREQLDRFLRNLAPGEPLAIYMRNGPGMVLLQNFTTDPAALLAAIKRAIPRIRTGGYEYYTDLGVLQQAVLDLSQYPGRKNLIWFTGGSNFFLFPLDMENSAYPSMRMLYDALEAERIAIYPIDVRGLTVATSSRMDAQHMLMDEEASTTGGKAYFNTNGIAQSMLQVLHNSADFYTITYSPNDIHHDRHWHKVRIRVDGPYHLSYRRGYYDDNYRARTQHKPRPLLAVNGEHIQAPDIHSEPIIFQAQILPVSIHSPKLVTDRKHKPPRGTLPYTVHYVLPAAALHATPLDSRHSMLELGAVAFVVDEYGDVATREKTLVQLRVNTADLEKHPNGTIAWNQLIHAPKGQDDIYLAVWDTKTSRLGTLQIPLHVSRH